MTVRPRRLPTTGASTDLGTAVLVQVLPEHHVIGDDDLVDAALVEDLHTIEQVLPAPRVLGRERRHTGRQQNRRSGLGPGRHHGPPWERRSTVPSTGCDSVQSTTTRRTEIAQDPSMQAYRSR